MQAPSLILFANSRPFEPFRIFAADGHVVDVPHPEMIIVDRHVLGLWIFHLGGQLEIVDAEAITALKTLDAVDPHEFMPRPNQG